MLYKFAMSKTRKVFSFNSRLDIVTGVQKVVVDVHNAIKDEFEAKIVGQKSFEQVSPNLGIKREEYIQFRNPFMFWNSIILVHERKFLFIFWLLHYILFKRIKVVYIHHSMLYGHKFMTIMPKTVVCISDRGRENLVDEFGISVERIHKIHNCVDDKYVEKHKSIVADKITVLYPARINNGKRQLEIVKYLSGKLDRRVQILFAGDGPQYENLKNLVDSEDANMECLGFVSDMVNLMKQCDFILLFSDHEGLPISLIEATMMGLPIICNDVGGNTEIALNGENAIVIDKWDELLATLNRLPRMDEETYHSMCHRSREIYEERFTFERFQKAYLNLLSNL